MQQSIRCSRCGSPNYPGQQYCWNCGGQLGNACPSCGAPLEHNARFCGNCGAQMGPGGQQQGGYAQQSYGPPPGRQQYGAQQGGYQAPPPAPPPQQQWGSPASSYAGDWAPRRQQSAMPLVILLVVLLVGLAGFAYWAFFGNPPWSSGSAISSPIKGAPSIGISSADNVTATVTIKFDTNSSVQARIEYSTDITYSKSTEWETNYANSHSIVLPNLKYGTRYYYRIVTRDKNNKTATAEQAPFRAGST